MVSRRPHATARSAAVASFLTLALVLTIVVLPAAAQSPAPAAGTPVLLPFVQLGAGSVEAAARNPNPTVLPLTSKPLGRSYGEWGAAWFQWAITAPPATNPLLDATGEHCALNQSGHVWFLAGSSTQNPVVPYVRDECVVPTGKALFFPIYTAYYFADDGASEADMRGFVEGRLDNISVLEATVDGVVLHDPFAYRATSALFSLHLPEGGLFDTAPDACGPSSPGGDKFPCVGDFPTVIGGYWIMLGPLSPGEHTIRFYAFRSNGFALDVTYELTVAPAGK